jgi:hypothetical protein
MSLLSLTLKLGMHSAFKPLWPTDFSSYPIIWMSKNVGRKLGRKVQLII